MAGKKSDAAASQSKSERASYLDALKQELAGYLRYGNEERAADVRAELKRAGGNAPRAASAAPPANAAATTPTVER